MKKTGFITMMFLLALSACAQDTNYVKNYTIGDQEIKVHSSCFIPCNDSIIFINLHDNENTSIEAAEEFLTDFGGTLIQLKHTGKRLIDFFHNNQSFSFDPNRMFSPIGRKTSLQKLGGYHIEAAQEAKNFADDLLQTFIDNKKLVVALHNNTEEGTLTITSFMKGQPEAKSATLVYQNPDMDPDDFILTTERNIYDSIKEKKINVVLQKKNAPDDGSLSIYAVKKNIPYINVEAQQDHVEEQLQMFEAIKDIIEQYKTSNN
jgi:hypothetical protein